MNSRKTQQMLIIRLFFDVSIQIRLFLFLCAGICVFIGLGNVLFSVQIFNWLSVGLPSTTSLTPAHLLSLSLPPLSCPTPSLPLSLSFSFGLPLRFIARCGQTAEKPPCMERSVISTLSSKHTAFHIVLQGLGQIAIFMGHDKGNATLCSHFLLPNVRAGHAMIHYIGNSVCVCVCVGVGWKRGNEYCCKIVNHETFLQRFHSIDPQVSYNGNKAHKSLSLEISSGRLISFTNGNTAAYVIFFNLK